MSRDLSESYGQHPRLFKAQAQKHFFGPLGPESTSKKSPQRALLKRNSCSERENFCAKPKPSCSAGLHEQSKPSQRLFNSYLKKAERLTTPRGTDRGFVSPRHHMG